MTEAETAGAIRPRTEEGHPRFIYRHKRGRTDNALDQLALPRFSFDERIADIQCAPGTLLGVDSTTQRIIE
jgi:hypothetical protein